MPIAPNRSLTGQVAEGIAVTLPGLCSRSQPDFNNHGGIYLDNITTNNADLNDLKLKNMDTL
jgi:hypothetical protein